MNDQTRLTENDRQTTLRPPARRRRATLRRLLARGAAGMTLIEIMVVVIIMGMIASAVGFGVFNYLKKARVKTTEQAIQVIQSAVRLYENEHPGQCPTVEQLQQGNFLDRNRASLDAWGRPFRIECSGDEVSVQSDGPDRRAGTDDDIPNAQQQQGQTAAAGGL